MIKRNIVFGLLSQLILMLLSLVSTHLIFKRLGAEVLGIINFSVTLTFFLILLSDMGISMLMTREIAAHRTKNIQYVRDLISAMSLLAWSLFFLSCIVIVIVMPIIVDKWLYFEKMDSYSVMIALQIISISLLLAIPRAIYGAVITGYERMDLWNLANIFTLGIQQIGMIAIVFWSGSVFQVALWYLVSGIIGLVPFLIWVARLAGKGAWRPLYKPQVIKQNFHFGSKLFANSIIGYLITQSDRWTISKLLPLSVLGYYGFAQGLVSKGATVPGVIANAAFPALSLSVTNSDRSAWVAQYNKLQDLCCYLYAPISAGIAMLGIVVIAFVFSLEVAHIILIPLILLSLGQFLLGVLSVPNWLAIAMKKPEILLRSNLSALFFVLPLTIILTFKFGLTGAALSSLIYGVWQFIYFIPRFCKECLETNAWRWHLKTGAYILLAIICYGSAWSTMWLIYGVLDLFGLVYAYTIGTLIFLVAGWFIIGKDLRNTLHHMIKKLFSRFKKYA